jgi:hypothetical protein
MLVQKKNFQSVFFFGSELLDWMKACFQAARRYQNGAKIKRIPHGSPII